MSRLSQRGQASAGIALGTKRIAVPRAGSLRAADGTSRLRDFDACFDALFAHYGSDAAWEAMPGADEALALLEARGLALAVVSNFDHRLPDLLSSLGLRQRISHVVIPADVGAAKPDRRIFDAALAALGVSAAEAVYVGDEPENDHAGAAQAGLRAVDVRELATLTRLPDLLAGKDLAR